MNVETAAEQLLFSTLRIQTATSVGTGFIINHRWGEAKEGPFLVTNKHVVSGTHEGSLTFTIAGADGEGKPDLGQSRTVHFQQDAWKWIGHPSSDVDIAALPLANAVNLLRENGTDPFYRSIPSDLIPGQDVLEDLDAIEEIIFIGYPNGIYDQTNNLPIVRKGITATPVSIDYNGRPIFLVDASVFPGSSGSPVLILNSGFVRTRKGTELGGDRVLLLGVLTQVMYREEDGSLGFKQTPASVIPIIKTREMLDLGLVYKSRTVVETIEEILRQHGEIPSGDAR